MSRKPARPPHGTSKNAGKTFRRLLSYLSRYRLQLVLVFLCIIISAAAGVAGSMFLQTLIDDYITPMLLNGSRDFSGLAAALVKMGIFYAAGIAGTLLYNRLMVVVAQGILKTIRDEMFAHMQTLPIRYFDTHASGDIMSLYTNDTDTLRQMLAQSIPQIFSSIVTVVAVFCAMLYTSFWLTLFVLATVAVMMLITKFVGGKSGHFFIRQQQSIGALNGYIEEMIHGQKVVKVFCHEEPTKEDFDKHNEELFHNATWANSFANILMPIMNNLGYVQYVLIAMLGGWMAFSGFSSLTLGAIASFLQLSRSFTMPVSQISQQASAIVMALAGAERIFQLLDETPETDEGYVTLVNAEEKDGQLVEVPRRTDLWAWKHPHSDGTVTYTKMEGDVRFYDVDFGYVPEKIVLHDVSLYAKPGEKVALVGATGAGKTTITGRADKGGSTIWRTARSATTASTSTRSKSPTCAVLWVSFYRMSTCSPARSWTTSATADWTPPMRSASLRQSVPTPITSSCCCRTATRRCSPATAPDSLRDSVSCSPLPEPPLPIRRS